MLERGAQKGGPKGENKWLDVYLEWAGAVQTLFATFHENSKYHRKCLYFGSHFRSLLVPFSRLFPKSGQRGPGPRPKVLKVHQNGAQGCPNGAQGCSNGAQGRPNGAQRSPKVPKRRQSVPHACPTGGPSCHNGVPRSPKCHKDATRPHKVPLRNQNVPQGAKTQASTHRHKQATNQITKEGRK